MYQKLGSTSANVNDIRLAKSAIIDRQNHDVLFASSNEATYELFLQELPSFMVVQRLKSQKHSIRDVKYAHDLSSGLLSCLSEDKLQLFLKGNFGLCSFSFPDFSSITKITFGA